MLPMCSYYQNINAANMLPICCKYTPLGCGINSNIKVILVIEIWMHKLNVWWDVGIGINNVLISISVCYQDIFIELACLATINLIRCTLYVIYSYGNQKILTILSYLLSQKGHVLSIAGWLSATFVNTNAFWARHALIAKTPFQYVVCMTAARNPN